MKLKPLKQVGVSLVLSIQLLAPVPSQAVTLGFLDSGGGTLSDLYGLALPLIQGLATDLLGGLSIGGIDLSKIIMDAVFSDDGLMNGGSIDVSKILGSILGTILDGSSDGNPSAGGGETDIIVDATIGSGGVLGTGSVNCLYASTCRPKSNPHQTVFSQAIGVQGYPNPNEVRGKIYQAATSGKILSDVYAPNPSIGAYYAGNQSDRDINRATTEAYLSKAGQAQQQKISETAMDTVNRVADLVKNCANKAKSSQELIRCNLLVDSVSPSFDAAQLSVLMDMQTDDQFQKLQLGNISASMDAQRRQRDVENAGLSISSMKAIWTTPEKW